MNIKKFQENIKLVLLIPIFYFAILINKFPNMNQIKKKCQFFFNNISNYLSNIVVYFILQPLFYLILNMMGWTVPSKDEIMFEKGKYTIWVFSHTSKMDFFLSAMYKLAQPEYGADSYVLLMPGLYNKFTTPILNRLAFLKATHSKDRGSGLVNNIIELSKQSSKIHVAMSPEGTLVASPWKAGYYWMAKGIQIQLPDEQVYIRVTGFDYYKKELAFYGKVPVPKFDKETYDNMTVEERNIYFKEERMNIETQLQNYMTNIIPLYPEKSFVKPNMSLIFPEKKDDINEEKKEDINEEKKDDINEEKKEDINEEKITYQPTIVNRRILYEYGTYYLCSISYLMANYNNLSVFDYNFFTLSMFLTSINCVEENIRRYKDLTFYLNKYKEYMNDYHSYYHSIQNKINLNYWHNYNFKLKEVKDFLIVINFMFILFYYLIYAIYSRKDDFFATIMYTFSIQMINMNVKDKIPYIMILILLITIKTIEISISLF